MKKPLGIWWIEKGWLYIRFENITAMDFLKVLSRFKQSISNSKMEWQPHKKAWRLSTTDMQKLALITYELFGEDSLQPRDQPSPFYQPPLI